MELRYIMAGTSLALDAGKCVGCGRCVEVCPHAVFSIEGAVARVAARERCMECGACARNCPAGAIAVDGGVGCAYAIINGILTGKEPGCDCGCDEAAEKRKPGCC